VIVRHCPHIPEQGLQIEDERENVREDDVVELLVANEALAGFRDEL